jgi:outer membrane protein assembly factor BamB
MLHVRNIVFLVLSVSAAARGDDWPQWRGPALNGISTEKNLPTKWSATENIAWKVPIPGKGHSSPIIVGERVFLTSALEDKGERLLLCLSRKDGSVLWQKVVLSAPLEKKHKFNNYASATPCSDGRGCTSRSWK